MAIGDDAISAGMDIVDPEDDRRQGAAEITKTRDYIAQFFRSISLTWGAISGKPSTFPPSSHVHSKAEVIDLQTDLNGLQGAIEGRATWGAVDDLRRGYFWNDPYNRNITWTRRTAWIGDGGQLGYASSSERYKKNIRPFDITDEQIAQLAVVTFQWRAAVAADDRQEVGLIAERLVDAGLGWAVFYDDQDRPEGINYDMIGVALLPAVQRLLTRVTALEGNQP